MERALSYDIYVFCVYILIKDDSQHLITVGKKNTEDQFLQAYLVVKCQIYDKIGR